MKLKREPIDGVTQYSAGQAARASGVDPRTLDFWVRTGIINASIVQANGIGNWRVFSRLDVILLRSACELRPVAQAKTLRNFLSAIRAMPEALWIVGDHRSARACRDEQALEESLRHHASAIILNLARMREIVASASTVNNDSPDVTNKI